MQQTIMPEKEDFVLKLVMGLRIANPVLLLMHDDDSCWLQYYAIRFFNKPAIILIDKREPVTLPKTPENIKIIEYEDEVDMLVKSDQAVADYAREFMAKQGDKDE